ncbi:MAG: peptidase M20 [Candidatus Infernicultor aquiphilus]|uniref:Peptidase M20 n=1 Tax=Candidatus Infernicultor aquiphilus TaxID=1805029 RepID=A0A1J5G3Z5_9BACT|nr:M20/M25/M40 family metallo-hydrolase [bacterium]OIP66963.1 MAG: peptidase M20 [Candidatus Atribacteria bacterium CG2_30_33_13]PIU25442.1 MAG: peptidase M20 [Candidatus Atribacteria bacterium CG08_land_8_20_14_0_20_33_29]PIW11433.1 MAG: peptidase M20 [Candidatus Atribacteria bacterium CG17_big_fil_post_rev_8_21_14_2_50_34_11]PIX35245.1 MAG: peptidase M20 [Candidatus Atribacteria bacterium CG_4_8_14_3_um_filter_34_18]PIY32982.1 MAG: peptidase M20 [Candidatus Atribacteria bacterium CG_4_10_14_
MINEKRLIESFMELVRMDSISREERNLADFLIEKLENLGLEVIVDQAGEKVGANSGNLIAKLNGNIKVATPIMFAAHMDTVVPGKNINPLREGEKIISTGETILGADDKAGIAAILEALHLIRENNILYGDIEILFTICEEIGLCGAKNLDISQLKAQIGFILDAGGQVGQIIISAPSQNSLDFTIRGKSAHAGANPEEGINAIQVAGVALSRMKLGRIDEETTANIGIISGGKATNIIPDEVILKGEVRSRNEGKLEKYTKELKKITEDTAQEFKARAEVKINREYYCYNLSPDDLVVKIARKAAKDIGLQSLLRPSGGGSDANVFNKKGLPSVDLAVGMEKVHTMEEYILIKELKNATEYILSIIKTVALGEKLDD